MRTEEQDQMIKYFWDDYQDLERWVHWEQAKVDYPEIAQFWAEYKKAEMVLDLLIRNL